MKKDSGGVIILAVYVIAAVMAIMLSGGGVNAFAYEALNTFSFHGTGEIDE